MEKGCRFVWGDVFTSFLDKKAALFFEKLKNQKKLKKSTISFLKISTFAIWF